METERASAQQTHAGYTSDQPEGAGYEKIRPLARACTRRAVHRVVEAFFYYMHTNHVKYVSTTALLQKSISFL